MSGQEHTGSCSWRGKPVDSDTYKLLSAVEQAVIDLSVHPAGCTDWTWYEALCLEVADRLGDAVDVFNAESSLQRTSVCGHGGTVKTRCKSCDGVIDSVPIKYGMRALMACPHCSAPAVLEVKDMPWPPKGDMKW